MKYATLYEVEGVIKLNDIREGELEQIQADLPDFAIIPAEELPDTWEQMTVEDGQLVPASEDVIAQRWAGKIAVDNEAIRATRERLYRSLTDPALVEALEAMASLENAPMPLKVWKQEKDQIRVQNPYKTESDGLGNN